MVILTTIRELPRLGLGATGEDFEFARKLTKDTEHYAVAGRSALLDRVAKLKGLLLGIRIKHFEPDRPEEA